MAIFPVAGALAGLLSSSVKATITPEFVSADVFHDLKLQLIRLVASIGLAIYTTVTVALIYLFEITLTLSYPWYRYGGGLRTSLLSHVIR